MKELDTNEIKNREDSLANSELGRQADVNKEKTERNYSGKIRVDLPIWLGGGGIEISGKREAVNKESENQGG